MIKADDPSAVLRHSVGKIPTLDQLLTAIHQQQHQTDQLQSLCEEQADVIDKKSHVIDQQKQRIAQLEEQLQLSKQKRFGKSSEKNPNQNEMVFNEAESLVDDEGKDHDEDDVQEEPARPRRKKKKRQGLSPSLPRVQIHHELSEQEKDGALDTFFVCVKEELDIVPAKVQVIEHLQEKAVFVDTDGKRNLVAATRAPHPLGKAIASPSLLAYLIVSKYADGLPLYRLEGILKRYGGEITRTTMANWLIRLSAQLQPVVNLLEDQLLQSPYIQGDETLIKVLKEPGMAPSGNKYMWVMRGGPPDRTVVMFNYDKSRGKAVAQRLLAGFEGKYFQSDGYSGYDEACKRLGVVHLGCWDHVRRKFVESVKAMPKRKKGTPATIAEKAVQKIASLYRIERRMDELNLSANDRQDYRQEHALPKLNAFKVWLERNARKVDKNNLSGKAIKYALNQWDKLVCYLEHGSLRISNVLAENAIRPFVVGRKAWLFADTPSGAKASAIYYSLIETAKANNIEPYTYLNFLIGQIATVTTVEGYESLLPWNMK